MMARMQQDILFNVFHIRAVTKEEFAALEEEAAKQKLVEQHASATAMDAPAPAQPTAQDERRPQAPRGQPVEAPKIETYRRDKPKVGRNDPCYCGSGKKYKACHLAEDEAAEKEARA